MDYFSGGTYVLEANTVPVRLQAQWDLRPEQHIFMSFLWDLGVSQESGGWELRLCYSTNFFYEQYPLGDLSEGPGEAEGLVFTMTDIFCLVGGVEEKSRYQIEVHFDFSSAGGSSSDSSLRAIQDLKQGVPIEVNLSIFQQVEGSEPQILVDQISVVLVEEYF